MKIRHIAVTQLLLICCLLAGCTNNREKEQTSDNQSYTEAESIPKGVADDLPEYKSYDSMDDLMMYGQYITDRFTISNHYWIDEEGTLWGTGENNFYQLGINNIEDANGMGKSYSEPVKIAENVIHVDTSHNGYFVVYLTSDHKLYGLGANTRGVLLLPDINTDKDYYDYKYAMTATPVLLMDHVVYASAGTESVAALTDNKEVYWWGSINDYNSTTDKIAYVQSPKPKLMVRNAKFIMNGHIHSIAVDESGALWTWGGNVWGECGVLPTDDCIDTPQKVSDNVAMAWPDIMTNWQNRIPADKFPDSNPYLDFDYACTLFVLKTDGNFYACGVNLGDDVRTIPICSIDAVQDTNRDGSFDSKDDFTHNYSYELTEIHVN